jgi:hypothetical protein
MKRGKDMRDAIGRSEDPNAAKEVMALMFVLVENAPGAFTLRLVENNEVLDALRSQGALQTSLNDLDELYANFRSHCQSLQNLSRLH